MRAGGGIGIDGVVDRVGGSVEFGKCRRRDNGDRQPAVLAKSAGRDACSHSEFTAS